MFSPTHVVPDGGLDAWASTDATHPAVARLDSRLDVQVVRWWGDWAQVLCSNQWSAWVDGRYLQALAGSPATAQIPAVPRTTAGVPWVKVASSPAAVGAALLLIATVLPWLRGLGHSTNAFKIPIWFLLDDKKAGHAGVLSLGTLLLLCSVGVIAVSAWPSGVPKASRRAIGAVAALVTIVFLIQLHRLLAAFPGSPKLTSTIGAGFVAALGASVAVITAPPVRS